MKVEWGDNKIDTAYLGNETEEAVAWDKGEVDESYEWDKGEVDTAYFDTEPEPKEYDRPTKGIAEISDNTERREPNAQINPRADRNFIPDEKTQSEINQDQRDAQRTDIKELAESQGLNKEEESITAGDIGSAYMKGSAEISKGVGYLLEKAGSDEYGKRVKKIGEEASKYWSDKFSDQAKKKSKEGYVQEGYGDDIANTILYIAKNPGKIMLDVAGSAPATGLGMGAGAVIGKTFTLIPKIGETIAYTMGYGLGEGAMSATMGAMETEEKILGMTHKELMTHPEYSTLYEKTGDKEKSKATVASASAGDRASYNMLTTTILSAPMGAVFSPIFRGKGNIADDFADSLTIGAWGEGTQETLQSGAEEIGANIAEKAHADTKIKILDGVVESMVGGAITGTAMGGGMATATEIHTAYTDRQKTKVREKYIADKLQEYKDALKGMNFSSKEMLIQEQIIEQESEAEKQRIGKIQDDFTALLEEYPDVTFPDEVIADIEIQQQILESMKPEALEEEAEEAITQKEPTYAEIVQDEKKQEAKEEEALEEVNTFFEKQGKKGTPAHVDEQLRVNQELYGHDEDLLKEANAKIFKKKNLESETKYKGMNKEELKAEEEALEGNVELPPVAEKETITQIPKTDLTEPIADEMGVEIEDKITKVEAKLKEATAKGKGTMGLQKELQDLKGRLKAERAKEAEFKEKMQEVIKEKSEPIGAKSEEPFGAGFMGGADTTIPKSEEVRKTKPNEGKFYHGKSTYKVKENGDVFLVRKDGTSKKVEGDYKTMLEKKYLQRDVIEDQVNKSNIYNWKPQPYELENAKKIHKVVGKNAKGEDVWEIKKSESESEIEKLFIIRDDNVYMNRNKNPLTMSEDFIVVEKKDTQSSTDNASMITYKRKKQRKDKAKKPERIPYTTEVKPIATQKDYDMEKSNIEGLKQALKGTKTDKAKKSLFEAIKRREKRLSEFKAEDTVIKAFHGTSVKNIKEHIKRRGQEIKAEEEQKRKDQFERNKKLRKAPQETVSAEAKEKVIEIIGEDVPVVLHGVENDITYDEAYQSRAGISMSPEIRARSIVSGHATGLAEEYKHLKTFVKDEEGQTTLDDMFATYRDGIVKRRKLMLARDSRTMSTMITGPANFPVRSQKKKQDAAHNALEDLIKYDEFMSNKIKSKLRGTDAILSTDKDAIQKLQKKLAKLEKMQENMKAANKIVRSKKLDNKEKITELEKLDIDIEETARETVPGYKGKSGFPTWALTNNNAKIKATKVRIASLEAKKEKVGDESRDVKFEGGELVYNYEADRVQFILDEKPSDEVRAKFKKNGFRWGPKNGAWQRKITRNAEYGTDIMLKEMRSGFVTSDLLNPLTYTQAITEAINKGNELISKNVPWKFGDTWLDKFLRRRTGTAPGGLGMITRKQEEDFVKHFNKLQENIAGANITAEEAAEHIDKTFANMDKEELQKIMPAATHALLYGGSPQDIISNYNEARQREAFNVITIRYLENPESRKEIAEKFPDVAAQLEKVRDQIDALSREAMDRGLIKPSQFEKWKDKYLSRLYLIHSPQVADATAVASKNGIKMSRMESGRKIESIVDYIFEFPQEAQRLGVVLDPNMMLKTTIAKTQSSIGVEEFFRGVTERSNIIEDDALISLDDRIANLPMRFSPAYAEQVIIPYIEDMIFNLRRETDELGLEEAREANIDLRDEIEFLENRIRYIDFESGAAQQKIKEVEQQIKAGKGDNAILPLDKRYGPIMGLPVSKDVASLIQSQFVMANDPAMLADKIDAAGSSLLAYFKWAKVPAQIYAYPRNLASNQAQWTMSGADPFSFPFHYARAVGSMLQRQKIIKKGVAKVSNANLGNDGWYDLARRKGVLSTNMVTAEINEGLIAIQQGFEAEGAKKRALFVKGMKLIGDAYGVIDDIAKIARIRYAIEVQGMTEDEAVAIAQEAHYNYALTYDAIRRIRNPNIKEAPVLKLIATLFPTYTQKTISFVAESIRKRPLTFFLINAGLYMLLHGNDDEDREAIGSKDYDRVMGLLPDWAKDNPMARIDMERTKDGTIDVTITDFGYIIPYGSLATAGKAAYDSIAKLDPIRFFEGAGALGVGGSPLQMVGNLVANKDSYTGKPIYFKHNGWQAMKDVTWHLSKQFGPGSITKTISLMESRHPILPRLAGINVYVYNEKDLEDMREGKAKKARGEAGFRGGKFKRQITDAKVKFEKGEITKEERNERISEAQEDVEHWKRLGQEAYEDISAKTTEEKTYKAFATEARKADKEYKTLRSQAKKNEERFKDFKKFKANKDKMNAVRNKKLVNDVDKRLRSINRDLDKVEFSSLTDKRKRTLSIKLEAKKERLLKKASQLIKDMK